jgi:hypothetical protein
MPRLIAIHEGFARFNADTDLGSDWEAVALSPLTRGVPSPDRVAQADFVVVLGSLGSDDRATQLGGALRLAVQAGTVAVCIFPVHLARSDYLLVEQVVEPLGSFLSGDRRRVDTGHPAFADYFGAYGMSGSQFTRVPPDAEVLGRISGEPAAVCQPVGRGALYVLPYHVADMGDSHNHLLRSVLAAVVSHREHDEAALPSFLDDVRLAGEDELLDRIDGLERDLEEERRQANRLRGYRHLIGRATGDHLESLVIETLNVVLDGTGVWAEDREDVGAEDFWLVGDGGDVALAEAKGIRTHVNRPAVNQVDNHRAHHGSAVEDLPGLLVVNVLRQSDDLAERQAPVSDDVVGHAVRQNVLILRTWDLFMLLSRKLAGEDTGSILTEAVQAGGGWLEVGETSHELHAG